MGSQEFLIEWGVTGTIQMNIAAGLAVIGWMAALLRK